MAYETLTKTPKYIMERKMVQRRGQAATMVLVKWANQLEEKATWEYLFDLKKKYPQFSYKPCGQGSLERRVVL